MLSPSILSLFFLVAINSSVAALRCLSLLFAAKSERLDLFSSTQSLSISSRLPPWALDMYILSTKELGCEPRCIFKSFPYQEIYWFHVQHFHHSTYIFVLPWLVYNILFVPFLPSSPAKYHPSLEFLDNFILPHLPSLSLYRTLNQYLHNELAFFLSSFTQHISQI